MPLPSTLVPGATAAARRMIALANAANGVPAGSLAGFASGYRMVNIWAQCVGGTSFDVGLWQYSDTSGLWALRTDIGTAGYITVTPADDSLAEIMATVNNAARIYAKVKNFVGGADANVWGEGLRYND